ncbi:MAG TPA: hypothetical protein VIL26_07640 [Clostridia bacterium]
MQNFSEVKIFQVKPDKTAEFEELIKNISQEMQKLRGLIKTSCLKRFYIFDNINEPPRELTKIVKCVKYFMYSEFDCIQNYAYATKWLFDNYQKTLQRLLIAPFDINCGESVF